MKRFIALMAFIFLLGIAAGCGGGGSGGGSDTTPEEPAVWSSVSAGSGHTVALKSDGSLWVWGDNSRGQLGLGDTVEATLPTRLGTKKWETVTAGDLHTFALTKDGPAYSWGWSFDGQLAVYGIPNIRSTPLEVPASINFASVSGGFCHTVILKDDGTLWMCGVLRYLPDHTVIRYRAVTQMDSNAVWVAIGAGGYHNLALTSGSTLWSWGGNTYGQLGNRSTTDQDSPVQVGTATDWSSSFKPGGYHCVAIKRDGSLWAWGLNSSGQLGDGTQVDRHEPVPIDTGHEWKSVSAGISHTLAIRSDGTLWAWGNNEYGQLGNGSNSASSIPVQVGEFDDWVAVGTGWYFSLGIRSGGSMWAWGDNTDGQLGNGTYTSSNVPVPVGKD